MSDEVKAANSTDANENRALKHRSSALGSLTLVERVLKPNLPTLLHETPRNARRLQKPEIHGINP